VEKYATLGRTARQRNISISWIIVANAECGLMNYRESMFLAIAFEQSNGDRTKSARNKFYESIQIVHCF
jgi:hypothetical protein